MDYRNTTAPLSIELLREKFNNKDLFFIVDYSNSAFTDVQFVTYLGNLGIACDVEVNPADSYEKRSGLLKAYLETRITTNLPSLVETLALCLLQVKNLSFEGLPESIILTNDEIARFVEENRLMMEKFCLIVDSCVLYLLATSEKFVQAFGHPMALYENIDDAHFVGNNFVHLFKHTAFVEKFFANPAGKYFYFTKQFEDYMFGVELNLFNHFMVPENPLPILFSILGDDKDALAGTQAELEAIEEYVAELKAI